MSDTAPTRTTGAGKLRLAVFDMVGTTVVAGDEVPASFREAFEDVGITLSDEAIEYIRGRSKRDAIVDLLARVGLPEHVDAVYARFQDALRTAYKTRTRAIPGAERTFSDLWGEGVHVVLTTGLDRETGSLLLRTLGWDGPRLTGMVTGDDVRRGRPAPDLIHAAMALAGVDDPARVAVIGDTTADLEAAGAAGVGWSIGVLSGAHPRAKLSSRPHAVILESVADLPGWLREVGAMRRDSSHGGVR